MRGALGEREKMITVVYRHSKVEKRLIRSFSAFYSLDGGICFTEELDGAIGQRTVMSGILH